MRKLKVTTLGVIQALKNVGVWLGTYTIAGIKADPATFLYAFLMYLLISVPTDIYMLNKAHEGSETE